jgi:arylsulfatase A-like enzyme
MRMARLNRRRFLGSIGAGAMGAALAGCRPAGGAARSAEGQGVRRPNILFLLSDDQRYDTIGALGNAVIRTPNLDALVTAGTAFTNPYIQGGTGGAICISSRAMLLSGRTLWRVPNDCGKNLPLWPQVMQEAGYDTFGIGKWHNGPASYARCFSGGAEIFFGGMSDHKKVPVHDFDPSGKYAKASQRVGGKFSSELFSDAAVRFLRERSGEKPFFLYVAYTAPHDPRMAPPPYADMYQHDKMPVPPNFLPEHPFDNGDVRGRDEMLAPFPRTPEAVRKHVADYYAMISHMDAQVGRVLAALRESGREGDTIVIFAGDNGLALGQHGLFGKQSLYEHSVRVPLVMRGPGVPAGERRDAFVYLHDVFPTVCEMTGVAVPKTVEGLSLAGVIEGRTGGVRDCVFAAFREFQRMVRDRRHKLIKYSLKGEKHTQLFDLAADPWETKNLADDPALSGRREALDARLTQWQKDAGAPVVL